MALLEVLKDTLAPFYVKFVVAAIIVIVGLILGQLLGKLVKKLLSEISLDKLIRSATGLRLKLESLIASIVKFATYFVFMVWALERIGLGAIILNIVAGGAVLLVILAFLLSIKDFIPNAVAGLFIQMKGIVKRDDQIKCQGVEGKVIEVDLVETKIETASGDTIYIPNSNLMKNMVVKKN